MSSLDSAIQTLVQRLQAVTTRLENVEKLLASQVGASGAAPAATPSSGEAVPDASSAPSVVEYDELISTYINPFLELSKQIGDLVAKQAEVVVKAVQQQRELIAKAVVCKKPSQETLQKLLEPTSNLIKEVIDLRDKNRTSPLFNHLSTISEGIGALGWVLVSPTPGPFVAEARAASEFYSNRILKDYRGKEGGQVHVDWVKAWNQYLVNLQAYIKKHHTTELAWTGKADASVAAPAVAGANPPPPPKGAPPPPAAAPAPSTTTKGAPVDPTKLFAELNRGDEVTKGLRKVTADMKTKNRKPEERVSVVRAEDIKKKEPTTEKAAAAAAGAKTRPPKLALEGNKWVIEYQIGNQGIVISETEPRHTVYIYGCKNSVVTIKGKINNITIDNCHGTGVVFDSAISSVEVVNSHNVQVQCLGKVPSFAFDKTSGLQLYLSKECLDAEIVTSKSDSMNVYLPPEKEGEDGTELPIPEQFKTVIKDRKLVTDIVRHE
jgi:adenylyl cyclase-associated protein